MADAKISQLPVATSSAGTDVLPIVQSSTTKQLAIQNLVPQNLKSNATTGVLQVTGPAAGATRVMTVPNANFTAARTDAAQSFTGDQTLATGNLIAGTAGKGIDFTAGGSGSGSAYILNHYEQGLWTPAITFDTVGDLAVTYSVQRGEYIRIGNLVICQLWILTSALTFTTAAGNLKISGLPFVAGSFTNIGGSSAFMRNIGAKSGVNIINVTPYPDTSTLYFPQSQYNVNATLYTDATNIASGYTFELRATVIYFAKV